MITKRMKLFRPSGLESVRESDTSKDVLIALGNLAKVVCIETSDQFDYGNYYFRSQLIRYYYTLQIILSEFNRKGWERFLDIGNYPGHLQQCLLSLGYEVDGVDLNPSRISDTFSDCRNRTITWDIEKESFPGGDNEKYDSILLLEVIEHLHVNPLNLMREMKNVLVDGGSVLISTPNLLALRNRIQFLLGNQTLEHPLSVFDKLDRHGSPGHQRIYSISELVDLLEVFGFEISKIWCLDNKTPFLNLDKYKEILPNDFPFELFDVFWSQNKSLKGKIRRLAEIALNKYFHNFYDNIYILATQQKGFSQKLFIERLQKADPWINVEKLKIG